MKNSKIIAIIALVVGVIGLAIGFATFSSTLTISSGASVTPNSSDFSIVLSTASNSTSTTVTTNNYNTTGTALTTTQLNAISVSGTTISGLTANFTEPGQYIDYIFYARNTGKYDAYLNNITGGAQASCTPGTGATSSLVTNACNGITIQISVMNNVAIPKGNLKNSQYTEVVNEALAVGGYDRVTITITYAEGSARADGPFTVNFADVNLLYETAQITY